MNHFSLLLIGLPIGVFALILWIYYKKGYGSTNFLIMVLPGLIKPATRRQRENLLLSIWFCIGLIAVIIFITCYALLTPFRL